MERVAVTGLGCLSGLGLNVDQTWKGLTAGQSGIGLNPDSDNDQIPIKIAGTVKDFTIDEDLLSHREAPRMDRFIHFALQAAKEALLDCGQFDKLAYEPHRIGSILGVGMGGFPIIEQQSAIIREKGPRRASPFFIPGIIPNMASGMISLKFGLKGLNYTVSSACASSAHAISSACYEIMLGNQDMMISGGTESVLTCLPIAGFASMKALSKKIDEPTKASRPFDKDRDGFIIGEGAGLLILENLEKAKARGAKIYAEVVGHGANSDAHHITAPHPEGLGAGSCMKLALESAKISPEQIGYVNAHGTSTPLGDIAETMAIKHTFGSHAKNMAISSTKSMIGHLLGAAGGVESLICIKTLETGIVAPTINLDNQDEKCDLNYTANKAKEVNPEYALNNSFGFGGTNSSLVFKMFTGK